MLVSAGEDFSRLPRCTERGPELLPALPLRFTLDASRLLRASIQRVVHGGEDFVDGGVAIAVGVAG